MCHMESLQSEGKFEYREAMHDLVQLTGHEFPERNHVLGLEHVLDKTGLVLQDEEKAALGLMLTSLSRHPRFTGNRFMSAETGEDPATHSLHVALLVKEVIESSGAHKTTTKELADRAVLTSLIHDLGEIVGELSTLHGRLDKGQEEDSLDFERSMLKNSLLLALSLTKNGDGHLFDEVMKTLSNEFQRHGDRQAIVEAMEGLLHNHPVEASDLAVLDRWLKLYDAVEEADHAPAEDKFVGYLVKTLEHIQGSQHFIRFSKHDDRVHSFSIFGEAATPWPTSKVNADLATEYSRSFVVMGGLKYNEELLGDIFATASSPDESAIAARTRDIVYQYSLEYLDLAAPVVERVFRDSNKPLGDTIRTLLEAGDTEGARELIRREQLELVKRHRELRLETPDSNNTLLPIETRVRLQALYRNAIDKGYQPAPKEILAGRESIPDELSPLNPRTSHLAERGVAA